MRLGKRSKSPVFILDRLNSPSTFRLSPFESGEPSFGRVTYVIIQAGVICYSPPGLAPQWSFLRRMP